MKRKINNGVFYIAISLVAVLAIGSVAVAYSLTQNVNVDGDYIYNEATQPAPEEINLGAMPSPDIYQRTNFHAGYQSGGTILATTTAAATYTLAVGDIKEDTYIWKVLPNIITTFTTMASSSLAMDAINIPTVGDTREIYLHNASTTVAAAITLAAGTGVDLQMNEDTADLATDGTSITKLIFIRKLDTDVMLIMEQFDVAD